LYIDEHLRTLTDHRGGDNVQCVHCLSSGLAVCLLKTMIPYLAEDRMRTYVNSTRLR